MLRLEVGRLLESHERLTVEKGNAERAWQELSAQKSGEIEFPPRDYLQVRQSVAAVAEIAEAVHLKSTLMAARRTLAALLQLPVDETTNRPIKMNAQAYGTLFRHLADIVSRTRDDCAGSMYFQIEAENSSLLKIDCPHFGLSVETAFPLAIEDISEAAACFALERFTACVFHLMRALEVAARVVADKLGATVLDEHGRGLPWGVIASNMKPIIDKMPKGSDSQIQWYRVQANLEVVNRAWRVPTAHPKQTYTPDEARRVFEATRAFMQDLATFA